MPIEKRHDTSREPFASVLFVSTFGWNPGDNFIQLGVQRLLSSLGITPRSSLIYNKSPQVTSPWRSVQWWRADRGAGPWSLLHGLLDTTHFDNSWKSSHSVELVDAIVFSGSPGWFGPRVKGLYGQLRNFDGEILFLGIGTPNRPVSLSRPEQDALRRGLVVTRESQLADTLMADYGLEATPLPCPALFAAPEPCPSTDEGGKLGFVFSTNRSVRNQAISNHAYEIQSELLTRLAERFDVEVVCHYVDDWVDAKRRFGDRLSIAYDFDPHGLIDRFRDFNYVVSTRVHGCGVSSSLGIPNALIGHDRRAGTVEGFRSRL